jgi:hypothetical protein
MERIMAKKEIAVGDTVNRNQILSISGEGKQRKYEVSRPCGHSTLLGSWQLLYAKPSKEGFSGCKVCAGASRAPEAGMVGRTTGTFRVTSLSTQRRNNHPLWNCTCTVCGFEDTVTSGIICAGKAKRCATCKKTALQERCANQRVFTTQETEELHEKIRKGVHSVTGALTRISRTNLNTTEDDVIQSAWAIFLSIDLRTKSWDSIRAVACVCGKNAARRVYNKCSMRFAEPRLIDGEFTEPLATVPLAEPNYEYESAATGMHRDNLDEALAELTSEERSLLLQDEDTVSVQDKPLRSILLSRLKNTLSTPSLQIQPLY